MITRSCTQLCNNDAGPLPAHLLKQILYEETEERIHALGRISDAEGSLVRTFFSPAHIRAASQVSLPSVQFTDLVRACSMVDRFWWLKCF